MNFLAHTYLSGGNTELITGNLIADFGRGRTAFLHLSDGINNGVNLHRKIDAFTDSHPLVKEVVSLFKPSQGRYASIITDISFDYFLGSKWLNYHDQNLEEFTEVVYQVISEKLPDLPPRFQMVFPKMKEQNWLFNYQFYWGIEKAFNGISRRASFESNMQNALVDLKMFEREIEQRFDVFFKDLCTFVAREVKDLGKPLPKL